VCSSLTANLGLALVLLTSALVPIDVFLAAFMKDNGSFKASFSVYCRRTDAVGYIHNAVSCIHLILFSVSQYQIHIA
jgi:hypothetical protein